MFHQTAPASASKTLSSRLMTMKFMQRAAASTPPSVPQSQPRSPHTPSSKSQKASITPSSIATPPSDLQLIQVALTQEEEKREKTVERLAEDAGETKWVLSTVDGGEQTSLGALRIVETGYSDTDQEAWRPYMVGRRSFGKFNRELEKRQEGTANGFSSSSDHGYEANVDEDGKEIHDPTEATDLIRASKAEPIKHASYERHRRKQQRTAEKADSAQLAEKRRNKEVKLNMLSSISGGGGSGGKSGGSAKQDMECYSCGEKGHARRDCPQKGKRRSEDWDCGPVKRSKQRLDY